MSIIQKWTAGLIGLGALYLVASNPTGIASGIKAAAGFFSSTEATAIGKTA